MSNVKDSQELAQIKEIDKSLTSLNNTINKTADGYLMLVKSIEAGNKNIKDNALSFENLAKAQKETSENAQKLDSLNKQLQQSEAKLKQIEDDRLKIILQNRIATQEATKAITDKIKAEQAEEGSLVRMRQKLRELTAEYDKTGNRTEAMAKEINDLSREIGKAEEATNRGQRSVGQYGKVWDGVKSLLPIASFAALSAAAVKALTAIKDSTGATADKFDFAMSAMKTGLNFFWQTLATGDWSNFTGRMKEAIEVGYRYAQMIDEIEDQTRSLSMLESDKLQENIDLEIELKNKNLTPEQRKQIGEQRIKNEEEFVEKRVKLAKKDFDNEMDNAKFKTKLTEDQLLIVAKDFDSEKKLDAEKYNNKVDQYNKLRALNTKQIAIYGTVTTIQKDDTPEIKAVKATIDATDKGVIEYAGLLKQFDILTDESKDKFAKSYIAKNEAAVSGKENIKKVYTMVNNMTKEMADQDKKAADDAKEATKKKFEDKIALVELNNKKEVELINQDYIDGITSDEEYKRELINQEKLYLTQKMSLYKQGSKEYQDIQLQIQSLEIKGIEDKNKKVEDKNKKEVEEEKKKNDKLKTLAKESIQDMEDEFEEEIELTKKYNEKKKDLAEELEDAKTAFIEEGVNSIFSINESANNDQLEQLNLEKEKELDNEKLTKQQRFKIEQEYAKKEDDIKRKQKLANKLQAAIEVGIKTAKTIFELKATAAILLSNPLTAALAPMALAQIPWVLGMSSLSLAAIAKYKHGTKDAKREFIAGEAGRELMFLRSGKMAMIDQPTYFKGSEFQGARIYSNPETEKLLSLKYSIGSRQVSGDGELLNEMKSVGNEIKSVRKAIQNKPVMIMDKEHRVIGQKMGQSQEIYLNRLLRNK